MRGWRYFEVLEFHFKLTEIESYSNIYLQSNLNSVKIDFSHCSLGGELV